MTFCVNIGAGIFHIYLNVCTNFHAFCKMFTIVSSFRLPNRNHLEYSLDTV